MLVLPHGVQEANLGKEETKDKTPDVMEQAVGGL